MVEHDLHFKQTFKPSKGPSKSKTTTSIGSWFVLRLLACPHLVQVGLMHHETGGARNMEYPSSVERYFSPESASSSFAVIVALVSNFSIFASSIGGSL